MTTDSELATNSGYYAKVANYPYLYRHTVSGRYYGVKKIKGKKRESSLKTSDRKIAERRLKDWVANLEKIDSEVEKTTLHELVQKFIAVNQGKSARTRDIIRGVLQDFEKCWPHGLDVEVRNIRPSHLEEWLARQEGRLRNTSYNRYAGVLKQLFELAVRDRIIAESPFKQVKTKWKKPQTPARHIPTVEEFQSIVDCIRSQRFTRHAQNSADFIAFLGLAGLGQAEASSLTWGDVDFPNNRLNIRRHKTDRRFTVPIYAHLMPLLEKLKSQAGENLTAGTRVLRVKDAKKGLRSACAKLGLPRFSQRNLRQSLIMRLWKAGVDRKLIAKWQGHQDGGQLILDTYTEVFGSDDDDYERLQLAKIGSPMNVVRVETGTAKESTADGNHPGTIAA